MTSKTSDTKTQLSAQAAVEATPPYKEKMCEICLIKPAVLLDAALCINLKPCCTVHGEIVLIKNAICGECYIKFQDFISSPNKVTVAIRGRGASQMTTHSGTAMHYENVQQPHLPISFPI